MRQICMITVIALVQGIVSLAMAQDPGDTGSAECRDVQLAVYDAVENDGPYKNHGQVMKAVNRLVNEKKKDGTISGRCAACIREQFARKIPREHQKPCGLDVEARAILDFATGAFERIRNIVGPEDSTTPTVRFVGTHVEVKSESWVYILDSVGHQVFRPIAAHPHIISTFSNDISPILEEWAQQTVPPITVRMAKDIALLTVEAEYVFDPATAIVPVRELITSKSLHSDTVRSYEGRTIVLFRPVTADEDMMTSYMSSFGVSRDGSTTVRTTPVDVPSRSYDTAITFSPSGDVMRVESGFVAPEVHDVVTSYQQALIMGSLPQEPYFSDWGLRFGTFFSPEEPRLELTAYSYEGERFLNPDLQYCWLWPFCNPFLPYAPYSYCYNSLYAPDVNLFIRPSRQYGFNTFNIWHLYGRKGGIRGNWHEWSQSWDIPDVKVQVHANLEDYETEDGHHITIVTTCDDEEYPFWHSSGNKLKKPFYDDLESCHVAMINTHGGPIWSHRSGRDTFQFMRNYDEWVALRDVGDDGLGKGKLRHLFLETCSPMNFRNNWRAAPKNLIPDWMTAGVADGIRTVSGFDGGRMGGQVTGWRFFGHYHTGESISQAWFNMGLEEYSCNVPIMVAYGTTEEDAAHTLFDGRFTQAPVNASWALASEPLTERLLAPRGCCLFTVDGVSCTEVTHSECEALGGQPLDCGTNCAEHFDHCE